MTAPRDRLRQHVMESVAKSGSGAVLVSAGEVAALFRDYDARAEMVAEYSDWIRYHAGGGDFHGFMCERYPDNLSEDGQHDDAR